MNTGHEPGLYPAITLRGMTVLPSMIVHLDISRERSVAAVEKAMEGNDLVFLVTQKDPRQESADRSGVYDNGTIARIKNVARLPHGLMRIMVEGIRRAHLTWLNTDGKYLVAGVDTAEEPVILAEVEETAMVRAMKDLFAVYAQENKRVSQEVAK